MPAAGADFDDVDLEIANRVALEGFPRGIVTFDLGQAADAVPLEAAVQSRAGKERDRSLQGIEAMLQRQQRVLAQGDRRSFRSSCQHI